MLGVKLFIFMILMLSKMPRQYSAITWCFFLPNWVCLFDVHHVPVSHSIFDFCFLSAVDFFLHDENIELQAIFMHESRRIRMNLVKKVRPRPIDNHFI